MVTAPAFGSLGSIVGRPGDGAALVAILERAAAIVRDLPGCRLYMVADAGDDSVWVVELWDDEQSHAASLQRPEVAALIAEARPLIAAMGTSLRFSPRGYVGSEDGP